MESLSPSQTKTLNEALQYVVAKFNLGSDLLVQWAAEAIHYANPENFNLKDSTKPSDVMKFKLWNVRIEYYINRKILLYNPRINYKDVNFLDEQFRRENKDLTDRILYLESPPTIIYQ